MKINKNFQFLTGEIKSQPNGEYLNFMHKNWWGDYDKLEKRHDYVQWLFPIQTQGMNINSDPLQKHELKVINMTSVYITKTSINRIN